MKLEGKYKFEADQEHVWEIFTNPIHLQSAIPGCEKLERIGEGKYDALLKIGIAAVKGTYTGRFEILDPERPQRYRLVGEGSGSPGFVKGETIIELVGENSNTVVNYQGDMQVGGLIASVGQRMIGGIAKMMLNEFFRRMKKELKAQE